MFTETIEIMDAKKNGEDWFLCKEWIQLTREINGEKILIQRPASIATRNVRLFIFVFSSLLDQ